MVAEKYIREAIMRVKGIVILDKGKLILSIKDLQDIIDILPSVTGDFPITSVCRDDLEPYGFDIEDISDDEMKELADRMEDDYCEQLFRDSMVIIARDCMGLPKVGDTIDKEED